MTIDFQNHSLSTGLGKQFFFSRRSDSKYFRRSKPYSLCATAQLCSCNVQASKDTMKRNGWGCVPGNLFMDSDIGISYSFHHFHVSNVILLLKNFQSLKNIKPILSLQPYKKRWRANFGPWVCSPVLVEKRSEGCKLKRPSWKCFSCLEVITEVFFVLLVCKCGCCLWFLWVLWGLSYHTLGPMQSLSTADVE